MWINVRDNLPTHSDDVLVVVHDTFYDFKFITIASYYKRTWSTEEHTITGYNVVTYWQPLPELP